MGAAEQLAVCPAHHEQLRSALDHIARTCVASRTQTRRIRWIEARATGALRGEHYLADSIDLPKSAGPNTAERLQGLVLDLKRDLRRANLYQGLTQGILMCQIEAMRSWQQAAFEAYPNIDLDIESSERVAA